MRGPPDVYSIPTSPEDAQILENCLPEQLERVRALAKRRFITIAQAYIELREIDLEGERKDREQGHAP